MKRACVSCGLPVEQGSYCPEHRPERSPSSRVTGHSQHRARRARLMATQAWICHICGQPITDPHDFQADHVTPVSHGGAAGQLRPAHAYCNNARGSRR